MCPWRFDCEATKYVKTNKQAVHENKCDYKLTNYSNLKAHKQAVHEDVKYDSDKCDFKATQCQYLKRHKQLVHEGVKYDYDKCDYKVTRCDNLKKHEQAVHKCVIYCVSCHPLTNNNWTVNHVYQSKELLNLCMILYSICDK